MTLEVFMCHAGSMSMAKKIGLWAGVVAAIVAVVTLVVQIWPPGGGPAKGSSNDNHGNNCQISGQRNSCVVNNNAVKILQDPEATAETIRTQLLIAGRGTKPLGPGPWPFAILGAGELGLKVRNDPGRAGRQIGTLTERAVAWVDCRIRNNFDPLGAGGPGPVWLKLRWPTDQLGTAVQNSQPSDKYRGWGYAGYLVPVGHDGSVPECR